MKSGKTTGVIIAVGLAAAATGIVVVAAMARWHEHHRNGHSLASSLRDIQDVLSDCDIKLRKIEQHLVPEPAGRAVPLTMTGSGT